MLTSLHLDNVLVLDIETVPMLPELNQLPEIVQKTWKHKASFRDDKTLSEQEYYFTHAGIYAEFGKIVCISVGIYLTNPTTKNINFRVKSFYGHDEKEVLLRFCEMLNLHYNDSRKHLLCGHNAKEFDFPYLCRRMLINGILLPKILDLSGFKPWEVPHLDTMQLWKFGDYKSYTSLELLASVFGIDTPKDDISGKDVCRVFWLEDNLDKVVNYCQKDVVTVAQLLLRFKGFPLLKESEIQMV